MKYLNGNRTTALFHEMSALDKAIDRYEQMAQRHFDNQLKLISATSAEDKKALQAAIDESTKHLNSERNFAQIAADVQGSLEEYRNKYTTQGKKSRNERKQNRVAMALEKHHPTTVLSRYMRAIGKVQPSTKHAPHHIVPGKGKTRNATIARTLLHLNNIRINDPRNGVWLVRKAADKGHWSMPASRSHLEIHTHNYERWILTTIRPSTTENQMTNKLQYIALKLQSGSQPRQVTMPPDEDWIGV